MLVRVLVLALCIPALQPIAAAGAIASLPLQPPVSEEEDKTGGTLKLAEAAAEAREPSRRHRVRCARECLGQAAVRRTLSGRRGAISPAQRVRLAAPRVPSGAPLRC